MIYDHLVRQDGGGRGFVSRASGGLRDHTDDADASAGGAGCALAMVLEERTKGEILKKCHLRVILERNP